MSPLVFPAGTVITRRERLHGRTWLEQPVRVVHDDGFRLAVLVEPGTRMMFPEHPFGPHPWSHRDRWRGPSVLQVYREGDMYSVWKFFVGDELESWYFNFEAPLVRECDGFATVDYGLDLVVVPDGGRRWKDVEDLTRMVDAGRITDATVLEVLRAATELTELLDGGQRWWDEWEDWSPSDAVWAT